MPQSAETKRQRRLANSVCANDHPSDLPATTMRVMQGRRLPLCRACDDALTAVTEKERELQDQRQARATVREAQVEELSARQEGKWPAWAAVTAEEVLRSPRERWRGPWNEATGQCIINGLDLTLPPHAAEAPYVFHCRDHAAQIRGGRPIPKRDRTREQGLCKTCYEQATLLKGVKGTEQELCAAAEVLETTVARISTEARCQECKARKKDQSAVRKVLRLQE